MASIRRQELERGLLRRNVVSTPGVVARQSVLAARGRIHEKLAYSEDLDLWFRLAHHCAALYRETVGHSYRLAPGSLTYEPTVRTTWDRSGVPTRTASAGEEKQRRQLDRSIAESSATIGYAHRRKRERLPSVSAFACAPRRTQMCDGCVRLSVHWFHRHGLRHGLRATCKRRDAGTQRRRLRRSGVQRVLRLLPDLHELEVIGVDDGSEDQSAAIVAAIADPRDAASWMAAVAGAFRALAMPALRDSSASTWRS